MPTLATMAQWGPLASTRGRGLDDFEGGVEVLAFQRFACGRRQRGASVSAGAEHLGVAVGRGGGVHDLFCWQCTLCVGAKSVASNRFGWLVTLST